MTDAHTGKADVGAIEARANAATPGPWTETKPKSDHTGFGGMIIAATAPRQGIYTSGASGAYPSADRTFIAHARTDIPALTAAYRQSLERIDALEKSLGDVLAAVETRPTTMRLRKIFNTARAALHPSDNEVTK